MLFCARAHVPSISSPFVPLEIANAHRIGPGIYQVFILINRPMAHSSRTAARNLIDEVGRETTDSGLTQLPIVSCKVRVHPVSPLHDHMEHKHRKIQPISSSDPTAWFMVLSELPRTASSSHQTLLWLIQIQIALKEPRQFAP